jgi:ERCC4 domain
VRKVSAEWDPEHAEFRPCEEHRQDEDWLVEWMTADEFVDITCLDKTKLALKYHIQSLEKLGQGKKIIVVLEGLAMLVAKAKNARNRRHDVAVRNQLNGGNARPGKDDHWADLDLEELEYALVEMQLMYDIRVVHTSSTEDSAEWISILATDIASIPYRFPPP